MMKRENIDEILAADEELLPSSGFLGAVMERIREEAAAPPPLPFPWKRALPGMVLAVGVLGWGAVELVRQSLPAVRGLLLAPPSFPVAFERPMEPACWVALALGASLASWLLSRRLAGSSGLL